MPEDAISATATQPASTPAPDKRERGGRASKNGQRRDGQTATAGTTPALEGLGLWDQIAALTDTEWQYHLLYIYRLVPPIRNLGDHYIERRSRPIDEDEILQKHGSGKYLCMLKNTRTKQVVGKITVSVHNPEAPPNIRSSQLAPDADPCWREWLERVEAKNASLGTSAATTEHAQTNVTAIDHIVAENKRLLDEVLKDPSKEGGAANQAQAPAADLVTLATKMAEGRDKLAETLASISSAPGKTEPDPMLKFVMDQLLEMQKSNRELTMKLVEVTSKQSTPPPQPSPIEQAKSMGELIGVVAQFANPAEPRPLLETVLNENLPRVINAAERFLSARTMQSFNRSTPAAPPPPGSVPQSVVSPPPATPPTVVNAPQQEPELDMMQRTLLVNIARRAQSALDLGMTGDQFGEQMLRLVGEIQFDAFVNGCPKDNLLPLLRSIPEAWAMLQPFDPTLAQFVEEFYSWATAIDEEDEPPPAAPEPKPAAKSKKGKK